MKIYMALYAPSSVQRILDFVKTIYSYENTVPVIVKPIGAAAQIGVPEAYKYSYKMGKPLIVLPELQDLIEVLELKDLYYISPVGEKTSIESLRGENIGIIINGGDQEPSKKELEGIKIVSLAEIPDSMPPIGMIAIILYILKISKSL